MENLGIIKSPSLVFFILILAQIGLELVPIVLLLVFFFLVGYICGRVSCFLNVLSGKHLSIFSPKCHYKI